PAGAGGGADRAGAVGGLAVGDRLGAPVAHGDPGGVALDFGNDAAGPVARAAEPGGRRRDPARPVDAVALAVLALPRVRGPVVDPGKAARRRRGGAGGLRRSAGAVAVAQPARGGRAGAVDADGAQALHVPFPQ